NVPPSLEGANVARRWPPQEQMARLSTNPVSTTLFQASYLQTAVLREHNSAIEMVRRYLSTRKDRCSQSSCVFGVWLAQIVGYRSDRISHRHVLRGMSPPQLQLRSHRDNTNRTKAYSDTQARGFSAQ